MSIRYDPKYRVFIADTSPRYFASLDREVHERDPSLGHAMAAGPDLLKAAKQLDRLSLLIKRLMRVGAASPDYDAVVAAISDLRAAIKKATAP